MVITKYAAKELIPGRIILVTYKHHVNKLGMILTVESKKLTPYTVLILNHSTAIKENADINFDKALKTEPESATESLENSTPDEFYKMLSLASNEIFQPDGIGGHEVINITQFDIFEITKNVLKIDADLVLKDWSKRQIERFRNDPVGKTCNDAIQELTKLTQTTKWIDSLNLIDVRFDLKIKEIDEVTQLHTLLAAKDQIVSLIKFTNIANFEKQFGDIFRKKHLENQRDVLEFNMSNQSMSLYPEYKSRIKILETLEYIDSQHRGKYSLKST